jgi:regulatory protein
LTDSETDAKKYSLKLLGYRARSESELRDRLTEKGFTDIAVSGAINFLKHHGFLDDAALAGNLKREALENRLLGYKGAKHFLLKRGINLKIVESALQYDENLELQNARSLAEKKIRLMGNDFSASAQRRLWNFIARRGYSFNTIKKVLERFDFKKEDII